MANRLISHNHVDVHNELLYKEENSDGEIYNVVFRNSEEEAEGMANKIILEQKNNIDAVTGATTTSKVLLKAIEKALALESSE